jgi:hypothetical protein
MIARVPSNLRVFADPGFPLCGQVLKPYQDTLRRYCSRVSCDLLGFVLLCVVVVVVLVTPASDAHCLFNRAMAAMRISKNGQ